MSDNPLKDLKVELSEAKRLAIERIKKLSGDSEWNLLQQIAQEIEADYIIKKNKITNQAIHDLLIEEVKKRYNDQEDVKDILLEAVPSVYSISKWRKKKGWEDAVWIMVGGEGLFTADKRSSVINKMYDKAVEEGNVNAAKIWLTLSGDYQEKEAGNKSEAMDLFRQLNEAIHSKK